MKTITIVSVALNLTLSGLFVISHTIKKVEYFIYIRPYVEAEVNDVLAQVKELEKHCESHDTKAKPGLLVKKFRPKKDTI